MINYPESVNTIISRLENNGYTALMAGGCVRDALMGIVPHDYDIAASAPPEEVKRIFSDLTVIPTGIKHGTVTVLLDNEPFEITTFRTDGKYSDNRRPESVAFSDSFLEDSKRRDFTINAMGYSKSTGLLDYHGGQSDIDNKLIRTVGDPDRRFNEDALRILRTLRFSSVLGFDIEEKTAHSAVKNSALLKNISAERIRDELVKLLCGKNVKMVLMKYHKVLESVLPEISPLIGFCQHNPHHIYDVWEHTVTAVSSIPAVPHLRVAALLHDMGKPQTFSVAADGIGHFYGHTAASTDISKEILIRLKFDNDTANKVLKIIRYHDSVIENEPKCIKRFLNKLTPEGFFDVINMFRADNAAQHPDLGYRVKHFDELDAAARSLLEEESCFDLHSLAVNGNDLISAGIPRGKSVGKMLNMLLEAVISDEIPNNKADLLAYVQNKKEIL